MSTRIPPLSRDELSGEQLEAHDYITPLSQKSFGDNFSYQNDKGALIGPMPFFLAQPDAGVESLKMVGKLSKIPGLPTDAKETAILCVGSVFKAKYELYAHAALARKTTDLEDGQVDDIVAGKRPGSLNSVCDVAYTVAEHLSKTPGPLPREIWDRSIKVLGKDGTVALVHYVGLYAYTCMVLNAIDAPVPDENEKAHS